MAIPENDDRNALPGQNKPADNKQTVSDNDIHDSERDLDRLKPDTATFDLPDVEDIPGQEHVHVLPMGELGDTTAASDDEEGKDLFGDE